MQHPTGSGLVTRGLNRPEGYNVNMTKPYFLPLIVKKSDRKKTTITIVNYSDYQDKQTIEKPQKDLTKPYTFALSTCPKRHYTCNSKQH